MDKKDDNIVEINQGTKKLKLLYLLFWLGIIIGIIGSFTAPMDSGSIYTIIAILSIFGLIGVKFWSWWRHGSV